MTSEITIESASIAVRAYGADLGRIFLERSDEIRGLLLATIAQEHVLLLGPPGTAKSALALSFAAGIGWSSFVRLLGRTTVPEELFGPYSLLGLESDRFERVVAGYLPTAEVAFVDEIFKGSSAILNGLLTVLNERAFDNGATRARIPLRLAIGASNELPQEEGLSALYDRFMLRFWVDYLRDETAFESMILSEMDAQPTLDPANFAVLTAALSTVDVRGVVPAILAIRNALAEERIVPSDRRWRKAVGLVRASAVLDGRTTANKRDLAVLCDCLWERPEHRDTIRGIVAKLRNPELAKSETLLQAVRSEIAKVPTGSQIAPSEVSKTQAVLFELGKMLEEAHNVDKAAGDPDVHAVYLTIAREAKAFRDRCLKSTAGLKV